MEPELLIRTFPRLYHMANHEAWPSIKKHGLLCTSALLNLFEITGNLREQLEAMHRPRSVTITHPIHGRAVVRDQKPMSDDGLKRCVTGASPRDWYLILNSKVFFWPTEERLQTLRNAVEYRNYPQCIITVDTRKLIEIYPQKILLCPMNSGATKPMPHPRSPDIFQPIDTYPYEVLRRKRGQAKKTVAEVAVIHSVPDISQVVINVSIWRGGNLDQQLYPT